MTQPDDEAHTTPLLSQPVLSQPVLTPAAERAAKEAEERRTALEKAGHEAPKEINGRGGLDPARFGDWEIKGIAVDF